VPALEMIVVDHTAGRVLDRLGIAHQLLRRWGEPPGGDAGG
jgi:3-polyprenyl-4-hydroxybenzoate decarboxylase